MPSSAFHRRIAVGFILVLLCAGLMALASIGALRSIRAQSDQLANRYAHELILVERLETVAERQVAAARGALLSRDEIYEQRVAATREEAKGLIAELHKEVQSPEGQAALRDAERALREYQDGIDAAVALRRSGASLDTVTNHWRANAAVRQEAVIAAVQVLRARKEVLLEQALAAAAQQAALLTKLIVAMTLVGLFLAATLAFLIGRTLVRMYNSEALSREAAEEARQWFATTLSSIGDAVIATDKDGKVTFLNGAAETLTAWNPADALGKPLEEVFQIVHEKTGEPMENPVQRVLQTGVSMHLANSTMLVARDGQRKPIDDSAAPIRDTVRGVTGVVLVFRDVSERRRAEAAVRESREWLETTVRSIGDAVIATDQNGRITLLNPVAEKLTGWSSTQAIGAPLEAVFRIVNELTRKPLESPVQKVLASGKIVGLANHTVLIARDGTEWPLDDSGAPIRDAQGNVIGVVLVFREITERRQVEETLRRLSAIVEGSNDAIIAKTLDGTITSWNAAAEALYGYTSSEVVGQSISLLVPPNDVDEMPDILRRLARGERIQHFETVRQRKDGSLVAVWLNVSPIHDASGRVVGASTIVRDITEKRKAEEALRNSERQFRTLADAIPQLAWMANADGWITWYNRRWYEYTGTTAEQMEGWGWQSVHDPTVLPDVLTRWQESIATGKPFDMVFPLRGADGVFRPFLTRVMPVTDNDGKVVRWFGTNTDLSAERQAQEAVEREFQHRRLALEAAELGAWDYHFDQGEVYWDERCRNQFGFAVGDQIRYDEAIARIHPGDRAGVDEAVRQALAGHRGGAYHREYRVVWADGSAHWISSHGRVYFQGEAGQRRPVRFIGVNSDITARKQSEEAILRSEKLASVGRMAASIAHEINNPLEAAMNALYLALSDPASPASARSYLQTADEQLGRVAQLTRQTLAFYREGKTHGVVRLPDLVEDVLGFYGRKFQDKQIEIAKRYDIQNGHVPGSIGELRQVFSNLIANSLDALPAGGKLHVRVKRCAGPNGTPVVRLTVADTGAGIAPEHVSRVFEPFFTTKQAVGTGLGLWIANEIVSRHGGKIAVRSRLGKGTVFCVYLPAVEENSAIAAGA